MGAGLWPTRAALGARGRLCAGFRHWCWLCLPFGGLVVVMTKDEALKLALEALQFALHVGFDESSESQIKKGDKAGQQHRKAITAIKEALAQPEQEPEFFTHSVDQPYDWSEWVCPDPKGYLMKCCDCGLVHEAEFGVVRYRSETEREDCDRVDDPNLQAVFRMRRSEQWSPEDTAHRAGGLPMAQPEQEPVAQCTESDSWNCKYCRKTESCKALQDPRNFASPPQRKPLTMEWFRSAMAEIYGIEIQEGDYCDDILLVRAVEAAHNIKENT